MTESINRPTKELALVCNISAMSRAFQQAVILLVGFSIGFLLGTSSSSLLLPPSTTHPGPTEVDNDIVIPFPTPETCPTCKPCVCDVEKIQREYALKMSPCPKVDLNKDKAVERSSHVYDISEQGLLWKRRAVIAKDAVKELLSPYMVFEREVEKALILSHEDWIQNVSPQELKTVAGIQGACSQLSVAVVPKSTCLAVIEQNSVVGSNHLFKFGEPHKNVVERFKVPEKSFDYKTRVEFWKYILPGVDRFKIAEEFMLKFLQHYDVMQKEVLEILNRIAKDKKVIVMAMNEGHLDIFFNFVASTRIHKIDISNLIVFLASPKMKPALDAIGVASYYHEGLGSFPQGAANAYGDQVFVKMMWFKMSPLLLVNRLGFDMLFQDADLVWFKDPFKLVSEYPEDSVWMDDGARSERYMSLYGNSGFFYLKSNKRTLLLMQELFSSYHLVTMCQSHQEILLQVAADHISRYGLTFRLLDMNEFPSGKVYHVDKHLLERMRKGEYIPYVFHMNWTTGAAQKLEFFKKEGWWYVKASGCNSSEILSTASTNPADVKSCLLVN